MGNIRTKTNWVVFLVAISAVLLVLYLVLPDQLPKEIEEGLEPPSHAGDFVTQVELIQSQVDATFRELGFKKDWIRTQRKEDRISGNKKWQKLWLKVKTPEKTSFIQIHDQLSRGVQGYGGRVLLAKEEKGGRAFALVVGYENEALVEINLQKIPGLLGPKGQIAIIIDDFGNQLDTPTVKGFLSLQYPLTLSVIPGLAASGAVARRSVQHQKEVMIHLPMEAFEEGWKDQRFLVKVGMSEEEIAAVFQRAIESVPNAKGLNNHMGSKATGSWSTMGLVADQLKKYRLYFIDSLTSKNSVAYEETHRRGVWCAKRDVFLDNRDDIEYIKNNIRRLMKIADEGKRAVGIGHVRANTLTALKVLLPVLKRRGYQLVYASEVVR